MAKKIITIDSILGGISPLQNFGQKGQYQNALAIDPDMPITDSSIRASGFIRPTAMGKFSSTLINGNPLWILTNPKSTDIYTYLSSGRVVSYSSSLGSETTVSSLSSASGNGAEYYDNYLYFRTDGDVARYGPLNGSPSMTTSYWVTTLSKTAPTNTTYPSFNSQMMPNGVMHRHTDNKLYFADVVGNRGVLHFIQTSKTTVEGDTNNGSTYEALDFPYGYYPTAIESYGTDLAVALIEGVSTTIKQKRAKVSFWDTTSSTYQKITDVEFPDPFITALKNVNGVLYVFSGSTNGMRVSRFIGGYSFEEVAYLEYALPPFAGGVDAEMNRIIWGSINSELDSACVYALGSKISKLGTPLHCPFVPTIANGYTTDFVTALKFVEQASSSIFRPVIGWKGGNSEYGLDKISTTYTPGQSFVSEKFKVGQPFQIKKIRVPLAIPLAANQTIDISIVVDSGAQTKTQRTINTTNFPSGSSAIELYPDVKGSYDFDIQLFFSGSALAVVALPIIVEIETLNDD